MLKFLNRKKKKEESLGLVEIQGDIIQFLRKNENYFAEYELKSIHKTKEETKSEFYLGSKILELKLKEVFENSSKVILIPPKYEFWTYIFLAIKFVKLGYKVEFLYYPWAKEIVALLEKYSNYLEYANLKFSEVENFEVNLNENPYVINFSDTLKGIRTTVPTFSTAYITANCDLDLAIEYIINHAFSFAGLKKSNLKRVIVDNEILTIFISKLAKKLDLGNLINDTKITSAQTSRQFQEIVSEAISDGAEVLNGSGIIHPDEDLHNVVLINVRPDMQVFQKKFFGPLLAITAKGENSLVKLFKQQPSRGIVVFTSKDKISELNLPSEYIYAIRNAEEMSENAKVLNDHPSLEYLLRFLGI